MDKIKSIVVKGVYEYFNILLNYGSISSKDKNQLLSFVLIEDLLNGPLEKFITEADMRDILMFASCLMGTTCLLPISVDNCFEKQAIKPIPE